MFGQIGEFFESLIKRISGVKDSGSIMPGNGGVLDRVDGVLLSAPLFYFIASNFFREGYLALAFKSFNTTSGAENPPPTKNAIRETCSARHRGLVP